MKQRWIKDYCPFARDQGFLSVIGDVAPGESVFGFTYIATSSGPNTLVFSVVTNNKVHEMKNMKYRVQITKTSSGSIVGTQAYCTHKAKDQCVLVLEDTQEYDVIIIGKVAF